MPDSADPRNGWSSEEVAATSSGVASNDVYGKLFYFVRKELRQFVKRISNLETSFKLLQVDVLELPGHVGNQPFTRIEVCMKVVDAGYDTRRLTKQL